MQQLHKKAPVIKSSCNKFSGTNVQLYYMKDIIAGVS